MFKVTRFCVRPYVRQGPRLAPADVVMFRERAEAMAVAARIQRRVAGAEVFEVSGWPVQDLWDEPRLLAALGETPGAGQGAGAVGSVAGS